MTNSQKYYWVRAEKYLYWPISSWSWVFNRKQQRMGIKYIVNPIILEKFKRFIDKNWRKETKNNQVSKFENKSAAWVYEHI